MSNPAVIHSKIGFSSRNRWRNCPDSVMLSVGQADKTSTAAAEGTTAHTVAEFYVRQTFALDGAQQGEAPYQEPPEGFDLKGKTPGAWNEELRRHGRDYAAFVQSFIGARKAFVIVESKVAIPSLSPELFGTGDCFVWLPDDSTLIAIDYKYGFEDVSCGDADDTNPQLAAYLVAAAETFNVMPRVLIAGIYQPRRVIGRAGQWVELTSEWLPKERARLTAEVLALQRATGTNPTPGDHCKYCRAKPVCPRTHEALAGAVAAYVGETNLHTMSDDEVVQLWACRSAFKGFWEDVQQRITNLSVVGHERLTVKTSDGRRKWKDEGLVTLTLLALGHTDLLSPKALSEVYDKLPLNMRDELVGRTLPSRTISLVDGAGPTETAKLFKKYSKIVDAAVKLD